MNPDRLASAATVSRLVPVTDAAPSNGSGFEPVGTKVLVLTDQVATQSKGGIHLDPTFVERQTLAICTGTLVASGGASFTDWPNSDRRWPGHTPEIGERIQIAKYAGIMIEGADGKAYRLIQDTDVCGVQTKQGVKS